MQIICRVYWGVFIIKSRKGKKQMKSQWKGILITSFGAAMWGLNAVAGKYVTGVKGVDPVWMVTLRLILAGLILLGFAVVKNTERSDLKSVEKTNRKRTENSIFMIWKDQKAVIRLLIIAIFAFAICQTSYFIAIDLSNAGISTAIQQTSPVFVLIWVMIWEKRLPKKVEIIVLIMVVFGAFILATGGNIDSLIIPLTALVMALISAITCAMYTVLPTKLIEKYGTFPVVGWGMFLAGIFLIPAARLWIVSGTWDMGTVLGFSYVVIFGTIIAFAAFLYGVTLVGPLVGSVLGLIEPVVATMASVLLLGQAFTVMDIIGIVAILGGVTVLAIFKEKQ